MEVVVAIFDSKLECYGKPLFFKTKGEAMRAFIDECNRPESQMHKHAADFTLFHVANYDEGKGMFENLRTPMSLGVAIEMVREQDGPDRETVIKGRD